jgi:hypothetical protein
MSGTLKEASKGGLPVIEPMDGAAGMDNRTK